jgi:peptidoglycan hydrolase-like protein with peptidoglycan-binding domain
MSLTGKGLADFSKTKIGTPYVYGAKGADGVLTQTRVNWLASHYPKVFTPIYLKKIKDRNYVGKVCCDCSGLISWYTGKVLGSAQLYNQAYARLPMSELEKFAIGTVLYRNGHVGVYEGLNSKGKHIVYEAKGIDYGTVASIVNPNSWTCGLTFSWIDYKIYNPIDSKLITYKGINPYTEPIVNIKSGATGDAVKWIQYELIESGYGRRFSYNGVVSEGVIISGNFDKSTRLAVLDFQKSCKLEIDGIVGSYTRKAFKSDIKNDIPKGKNLYAIPTVNIKSGSRGSDVLWLQTQLSIKGYMIEPNGMFDLNTYNAVIKFQKEHKLITDGIVGKLTRTELLK